MADENEKAQKIRATKLREKIAELKKGRPVKRTGAKTTEDPASNYRQLIHEKMRKLDE